MCSFIFFRSKSYASSENIDRANRYSRHRGPDRTTILRLQNASGYHLAIVHNLLDISGTAAPQPTHLFTGDENYYSVFNGEVYNFREYGDFNCDTDCILPTWAGTSESVRSFDGEYAVVIYEDKKNRLSIFTDTFLTKPVFVGFDDSNGDFGTATCASSLRELGLTNIEMCRPNSLYQFELSAPNLSGSLKQPTALYDFCLSQTEQSYNRWNEAFLESVRKRATHGSHRPVVFMSSGYDSGAICLALNLLKIDYDTFSIRSGENNELIDQRIELNREASCGHAFISQGIPERDIARIKNEIENSVEPFRYVHEDQPGFVSNLINDGGAIGGFYLAEWARREGRFVNLSGSGADEIVSDYGWNGEKIYHHSEFGGRFPETLEGFFPWKKFYDDTQRSYLFKDEYILGRWGIEGRYPFLDRSLVQAFLSLTQELKNRAYKAPIEQFLEIHGYPFEKKKKRGFSPTFSDEPSKPERRNWRSYLRRLFR